jgi:magnesium chelatase subunit H
MASKATTIPVRVVIVTLDAHLAGAFERARTMLRAEVPGLELRMHVAAEYQADPAAAERARADIAAADFIVATQLFTEESAGPVKEAIAARKGSADAICCALCVQELVTCTSIGKFDMGAERSAFSPLSILKKLRGKREDGKSSGERQMAMLRQLPKLLKFIPGAAQDVRIYFLAIQYWLGGSDVNIANMLRMMLDRYSAGPRKVLRGTFTVGEPVEYPEIGVYHPDLPGARIAERASALPSTGSNGTIGLMLGRSYLLADNTAHYDAVIRGFEARGLRTVPVFASGLDARPAIEKFFRGAISGTTTRTAAKGEAPEAIDAMVNLTGFSLVGGPAYNDSEAAKAVLAELDVPYIVAPSLEFQRIDEWQADARGLNPLQATLQVAIPELDGATNPVVFGGRTAGKPGEAEGASEPIDERIDRLADRVARLARLRRTPHKDRKVAIVIFNFPPNAGNTGSAAYLAVFESLQRTLAGLAEAGYTVDIPSSPDDLRVRITEGNAQRYGAPANVAERIAVDDHVRREPYLAEIERTWGAAPGRQLSDGRSLFVMGEHFGNVFVGVQPAFGWEGDPMRLLFEGNFAPTHAFSAFYRWLREDYNADVVLHFGTHGALEFMPGKQVGLSDKCWPERLIGDLPNVYLYASNNSSEGTMAKRRGLATLVSYLTPPIANAGLYKDLAALKASVDRFRQRDGAPEAGDPLVQLIQEQAVALELCAATPVWTPELALAKVDALRDQLRELEQSLIPLGLHVVGQGMPAEARVDTLYEIARLPRPELGLPSLIEAIAGEHPRGERLEIAERGARTVVETVVEKGSSAWARDALARDGWVRHTLAFESRDLGVLKRVIDELARLDALLREDHELPGLLRALDARYVQPAPGGDLLRSPNVLPTGRNIYGFDPYKVPSAFAMLEGRARAELLLKKHVEAGHEFPETIAFVLWGTDNMKSEGVPLAECLALMGAAPRFDAVGRLCGARLIPLEQLGRPRVDVVATLSGIFRDLLPLQVKLLAEAALLASHADEPTDRNFIRKHTLDHMASLGVDLETAALRVFSNADGAYGSNVNLLIDTGTWQEKDELAEQFVRRKSFAYGADGRTAPQAALFMRTLGTASLSFQNLDSVELGATDIDQYVESLGGMHRVIEREKGAPVACYVGDHNGASGKVRTLEEQVALETRTKLLNPKWFEAQIACGYEGVRNIAGHVTTTVGWSATTETVPTWVYQEVTKQFVLDAEMRERLAALNANAASGIAQRLLEASDRGFWTPDAETLAALRAANAELEDRLEGVFAKAS